MMDVLMPQLGETVEQGVIIAWFKAPGDAINADEILFEVETDKVTTEVPSLHDGVLAEILVGAGEAAPVGARLAIIRPTALEDTAGTVASSPSLPSPPSPASPPRADQPAWVPHDTRRTDDQGRPLSPAVRRLIARHGIDPALIDGSGRAGRVTKGDVRGAIDERNMAAAPAPASRAEPDLGSAAPALATGGTRLAFTPMRRRIAEHMVRSKATSPHVLQVVEIDFGRVEAARRAFKARTGTAPRPLAFIARATCIALRDFPHLNASIDENALILHDAINLSIAVDLGPDGLVAPVIRGAQALTVADLARCIGDLAMRARVKKLGPDDLTGGTYSISNNGSYDTLLTAPIINQPQVAILSMDAIRKRPVVIESETGDSIGIRPIGMVAQSFDHRAIDGAYSAAFLRRVMALVETYDWKAELG